MGLRIVIMGAPGAGKGTQAARMAESYGLPHISTGEIFRRHIHEGTELGKQVQAYIDAGRLAPDDVACELVAQRLAERDCASGYILDGFPRSRAQAECLEEMLAQRGEELNLVINLNVDDEELVDRLAARRMCPVCGKILNLRFLTNDKGPYCDRPECGEQELMQREDDREETVRERLKVYHKVSEPIVAYYADLGKLYSVPAKGKSPDAVFTKIEELIDSTDVACHG